VGARPGGYWRVQGTSFAAPLVSAAAALVRSRWPAMSAGNVVNRLIRTARDVGPVGRDESYGFGALDPLAALTWRVPEVAGNPLDTAPPPGVAGFGPAPGSEPHADTPADQPADDRGANRAGGGAEPVANAAGPDARGGLLGGVAVFLVLVTGGVLVVRRLDRPPW
jgi:subtilisin family serine protease